MLVPWLSIEAFALITEFMQILVPGRSCDMKDFVADSLGIILAILCAKLWWNKKSSR